MVFNRDALVEGEAGRLVHGYPCSLGSGMTKETECHFVSDTGLQKGWKLQVHALQAILNAGSCVFACLYICIRRHLHDELEFSAPRPRNIDFASNRIIVS